MKAHMYLLALVTVFGLGYGAAQFTTIAGGPAESNVKGWTKGKGWGPWGAADEIGSLNGMTPASIRAALGLAKTGKVYDLGVNYDAESFKWPGHNPATIMMYRGPEGVRRQGDVKVMLDPQANPAKVGWHSCALFISDNVGTQIDGLGHITNGPDNQWYNGYRRRNGAATSAFANAMRPRFRRSSHAASCSTLLLIAKSMSCRRTTASPRRSCKTSPAPKRRNCVPATAC